MKIIFIIFLFISILSAAKAQIKNCDECCVYKARYTDKQRVEFYPFNIAATIKIVSFRHHWDSYPFKDSLILNDSLIETHTLSKEEISALTDLMYNNFRKKKSNIGSINMCFWPRNAILFIDKNGKLLENILICFHCSRIELSSDKMYNFEQCSGKLTLLLNFFKTEGIKFGTDLNIDDYEGETPKTDIILPPSKN